MCRLRQESRLAPHRHGRYGERPSADTTRRARSDKSLSGTPQGIPHDRQERVFRKIPLKRRYKDRQNDIKNLRVKKMRTFYALYDTDDNFITCDYSTKNIIKKYNTFWSNLHRNKSIYKGVRATRRYF